MGQIQPAVCFYKVLSEHYHACSFTYCLWLLSHYKERIEMLQDRPHGHPTQHIYYPALEEEVCQPLKSWHLQQQWWNLGDDETREWNMPGPLNTWGARIWTVEWMRNETYLSYYMVWKFVLAVTLSWLWHIDGKNGSKSSLLPGLLLYITLQYLSTVDGAFLSQRLTPGSAMGLTVANGMLTDITHAKLWKSICTFSLSLPCSSDFAMRTNPG